MVCFSCRRPPEPRCDHGGRVVSFHSSGSVEGLRKKTERHPWALEPEVGMKSMALNWEGINSQQLRVPSRCVVLVY